MSEDSQQPKMGSSHNNEDKKPSILRSVFGFESYRSFVLVILAIIIFRASVMSPYHVPTGSMEPTIKVGDRLLAWKLAYGLKFPIPFTEIDLKLATWGKPKHSDIIVFRYPKDLSIDYVKRVIAVEGDSVAIRNNIIYINGEAQEQIPLDNKEIFADLQEEEGHKIALSENLKGHNHIILQNTPSPFNFFTNTDWPSAGEGDYVVPPNSVFVIGDNRDNSQDSRIWGEVPLDYVRGKAIFVIWSIYQAKGDSWPKLRYSRFGHRL